MIASRHRVGRYDFTAWAVAQLGRQAVEHNVFACDIPVSWPSLSPLFPQINELSGSCLLPSVPASSHRLRNLPRLLPSGPLIHELLPTNRHHLIARLTNSHHNTKLVLRRAAEIAPLVSQTDHHSPHHVSNPEALRDLDFINFRRANILLPDRSRKDVAARVLASRAEREDGEVGLARICACDAAEYYGASFRDQGTGGASD
jgi:hypothetical protein